MPRKPTGRPTGRPSTFGPIIEEKSGRPMAETLAPLFEALPRDESVVAALSVQFGIAPSSRQVARWRRDMKEASA